MRNACPRIVFLCVMFVGCVALARGDVQWGEPTSNPETTDEATKRKGCTDQTGQGVQKECDKSVGDQWKTTIGTVGGQTAKCAEATKTYRWGQCSGPKRADTDPDCATKWRPCLDAKFFTQVNADGSCAGVVITDGVNPIIRTLYVSGACEVVGVPPVE